MKKYKVNEIDNAGTQMAEVVPGLIGKTCEQKKLYEFLSRYYTDGETALKIINGGYQGYCYGGCGYAIAEDMDGQEPNLISDDSLEHDYYIGSMI